MNALEFILHLCVEQPLTMLLAILGCLAALGGVLMMLGTVWAFLDFLYREGQK